jgi:hypothetical protein
MRIFAAALLLAAAAGVSADAQPTTNGMPMQPGAKPAQICIQPMEMPGPGGNVQTRVLNPQTILFYMPDGKIWMNKLHAPCRGLMLHGFAYLTRYDELCSNAVGIRVLESGQVCELGAFTPYVPPRQPQAQTANP